MNYYSDPNILATVAHAVKVLFVMSCALPFIVLGIKALITLAIEWLRG